MAYIPKKAWKPGQSGNPKGRPPANLCVTTQLVKQLGRTEHAAEFAEAMIKYAKKGDAAMVREILERVEGKVVQRTENETKLVVKPYEEMTADEARAALSGMLDALSVTEGIERPCLPWVNNLAVDIIRATQTTPVTDPAFVPSFLSPGPSDPRQQQIPSITASFPSAGGPIITSDAISSSLPAGSADFPGGQDASNLPVGFVAGPADNLTTPTIPTVGQEAAGAPQPSAIALPGEQPAPVRDLVGGKGDR